MPFYEYQCSRCGHHLEALQKVSDPPMRKCPECGKTALKKLVSPPVFRLKGSGWYETDFKSDQEGKRNLAGEKHDAAGDKPDAKAAAKVEAKPDAKVDAKVEAKAEARPAEAAKPAPQARPAANKAGRARKPAARTARKPPARRR